MEKRNIDISPEGIPPVDDESLIVPEEGENYNPDEETEKWRFEKEFGGKLIDKKTQEERKKNKKKAQESIKKRFGLGPKRQRDMFPEQ